MGGPQPHDPRVDECATEILAYATDSEMYREEVDSVFEALGVDTEAAWS